MTSKKYTHKVSVEKPFMPKGAYVITPNMNSIEDAFHRTQKPSLKELQKWVGGYIQVMPGSINGHKFEIVMDEEGKMKEGNKINYVATAMMNLAWGIDITKGDEVADVVMGTVVVLKGFRV
tara:strand:+ start:376 stop:738 length:363 start_codon:yes stop_codon:yes gene_type:complete